MIKSIIKEILIILLLVIAIILVLGIIFYDYRPSTGKIPAVVGGYDLPEEMEEELNETIQATESQNIVQTYRVNGEDLNAHERSKDYIRGKINPFDEITSTNNNTNDSNTNSNNSANSNSNETPQNGTGTQGNFLNTVK